MYAFMTDQIMSGWQSQADLGLNLSVKVSSYSNKRC
jgi:hypothetical protein